jgi:hypothetical protein
MARTIETIKAEMIATKNSLSALSDLTSESQVSLFGNIFYVTAVEVAILEQLIDAYILDIETIIQAQAIGSTPWLRAKVLEFQYGDNVELDTTTFAIEYPVPDTTKQIITRCSVKETGNLVVQVKVAKSDPPEALAAGEVTALEDYVDRIQPAGTQINVVSLDSDKLYIEGTIYYQGQFSSVIQDTVELALTNYMTNLSSATNFDGIVKINTILDTIQAVEGVSDVRLSVVAGRADATAFISKTTVFDLANGVNLREYETFAGYIVEETESGQTFSDKITYVAV